MRSFVFVTWLLVLPTLSAQPAGKRPITTEDYASLAAITELAVSNDGRLIAYSEARWSKKEDNRRGDLWLHEGTAKRLTNDRANERHLRWLADGSGLYVLANRKREGEKKPPYDGTTQVWYVSRTGDVKPVTSVDGGIDSFDYAPDANTLVYSVATTTTDSDDFSGLRAKYAGPEYGHGSRKTSVVYRIDLTSWRTEKIVAEPRYVREFAISRDGRKLAMLTAPDDTVVSSEGKARLDVWDAGLGKVVVGDESWRKTAASPYPWLEGLAWAADGKQVAFCSIFDAYPAEVIVHTQEGSQWVAKRMPRPEGIHVRGYGAALAFVGSQLYYTAEKNGNVDLLPALPRDDERFNKATLQNRVVSLFAFSGDGKELAVVSSRADLMSELYAGPVGAKSLQRLTMCNPQADQWLLPTVKHITWKASDGTTVGGVLELPPNYKEGTKLPLVVAIHGGPTTSSKTELSFDPHNGRLYFAAHGYAVLVPNYRGSTGYGDKFTTDLVGRENDIEVKDILAGIQHLVKEGIADENRVGVMGWSNGGYLTNCLIALKDSPVKIRAASSGAGIVDTVAEWGFNDEPAYPIVFKKGLPWETPDIYKQTSPTYQLGNVTTPTLIHVGGGDERCPPGHSRMLYRALREYNKVPTELLVYPGEPHGLTKLSNRTAKMDWDLAWFKKYLRGE